MYCGGALSYRGEHFTRIISPVSRLFAYKVLKMQCKGNIFKFSVEWTGKKLFVFFNGKLAVSGKR